MRLLPAESRLAEVAEDSFARDEDPEREARRVRQLRERHRTMLGVALAIIILAFLLRFHEGQQIALVGLSRFPLPELCGSRLLFGLECPGCGLTRSFLALAQGDWETSLRFHRVGWLLALAVVLQIPYRLHRLRELKHHRLHLDDQWPVWFGRLLIAALFLNWFLNLLTR